MKDEIAHLKEIITREDNRIQRAKITHQKEMITELQKEVKSSREDHQKEFIQSVEDKYNILKTTKDQLEINLDKNEESLWRWMLSCSHTLIGENSCSYTLIGDREKMKRKIDSILMIYYTLVFSDLKRIKAKLEQTLMEEREQFSVSAKSRLWKTITVVDELARRNCFEAVVRLNKFSPQIEFKAELVDAIILDLVKFIYNIILIVQEQEQ